MLRLLNQNIFLVISVIWLVLFVLIKILSIVLFNTTQIIGKEFTFGFVTSLPFRAMLKKGWLIVLIIHCQFIEEISEFKTSFVKIRILIIYQFKLSLAILLFSMQHICRIEIIVCKDASTLKIVPRIVNQTNRDVAKDMPYNTFDLCIFWKRCCRLSYCFFCLL